MDMNREALLKEIMAIDFSVIDLNLYLNTHPNDQRALAVFNNYVLQSKALWQNYERSYGPLSVRHSQSAYPWQWINSPWPWERQ